MEVIFSALIMLAVAVFCVSFLAAPFFKSARTEQDEALARRANLEWEKNTLLQNIKELEMDYREGKLAEEDWRAQRSVLIEKVAKLISALKQDAETKSLDDEIEKEIAKAREARAEKKGESRK